jgi:membrane protein
MERLRRLGERWPWLARVLDIHERVGEVNGGSVASSVTLTFFVSLFPLALAAIAIVGFIEAGGDTDVAEKVIDNLSLTGSAATTVQDAIDRAADSRRALSVLGFAGLLWAGLGVTSAVALAIRAPWQLKAEGVVGRAKGVMWLLGSVLLGAAAAGLGWLLNVLPDLARPIVSVLVIVVGLAVEGAFFVWSFWALGDRRIPLRAQLPGAIVGAAGLEVLKVAATVYLPRLVEGSSALYGPLGVVFAILAWLALFARLIVYASASNAVLYETHAGTLTLEVKAPKLDDSVPLEADRGGAVKRREPSPPE